MAVVKTRGIPCFPSSKNLSNRSSVVRLALVVKTTETSAFPSSKKIVKPQQCQQYGIRHGSSQNSWNPLLPIVKKLVKSQQCRSAGISRQNFRNREFRPVGRQNTKPPPFISKASQDHESPALPFLFLFYHFLLPLLLVFLLLFYFFFYVLFYFAYA